MKLRTIQHPGVEINEYDISTRPSYDTGINGLVFGFTAKGPLYEYTKITSLTEFIDIYGEPQTEPEVYLYIAVQSIIANGGVPLVSRLPYNNTQCKNYKCIQYKLVDLDSVTAGERYPIITESEYGIDYSNVWEIEYVNSPTGDLQNDYIVSNISHDHYDILKSYGFIPSVGEDASGSINVSTDFVIVDKNKSVASGNTTYEKDENNGYVVGIVDINQAIKYQRLYDSVSNKIEAKDVWCKIISQIFNANGIDISTVNNYSQELWSETNSFGTLSLDLVRLYPQIPLLDTNKFGGTNNPASSIIDKKYSNHIVVFVAKTSINSSTGRVDVIGIESFVGSIFPEKDDITGRSVYIGDLINNNSNYIEFYSRFTTDGANTRGSGFIPANYDKSTTAIVGADELSVSKFISFAKKETKKNIPLWNFTTDPENNSEDDTESAVNEAIKYVSNVDDISVHFVCDAGLSSVMTMLTNVDGTYGTYVPESWQRSKENLDPWFAVINKLNDLAASIRKDCFFVFDAPRGISLDGSVPIVRKSKTKNTFNDNILPYLSYCSGLNSSYAGGYFNWVNTNNPISGNSMWVPTSCKVIGNYIYQTLYDTPWLPPAGSNYGTLTNVNNISHNPSPTDEDQIYLKHWNYIKRWPIEGYLVEGQKTTLTKNSALNRINVRLTLLELERYVYQRAHYFKYQPNNQIVRDQFVETMKVKFADYLSRGGLYDYKIVADSSNNTPETIDNNELRAAFYVKPSRAIEYILCDFIITKSDSSFDEQY